MRILVKLVILLIVIWALMVIRRSTRQRRNAPHPTGGFHPNKDQMIVLWVAIGLLSLIGLVPPWVYTHSPRGEGGTSQSQREAGYHPIFNPPAPQNPLDPAGPATFVDGVRMDIPRIAIQCAVVVLVTGGLFWTLRDRS